MSTINLADFIPDYLAETREHLAALERGLLALEAEPAGESRAEIIHTLFRSAHTIKGSSRMVGYEAVARVAHAMEDVLGVWRDGQRTPDRAAIDELLQVVDHLRRQVEQPPDFSEGVEAIVARLQRLLSGEAVEPAATLVSDSSPTLESAPPVPTAASAPPPTAETQPPPLAAEETVRVAVSRLDELLRLTGELVMNVQGAEALDLQTLEVKSALQALLRTTAGHENLSQAARSFFERFDAWSLDYGDNLRLLNATVKSIEQEVMALRLLPLSTLFAGLPRLVRDLAHEHEKQIELTLIGETTELDRRILQGLGEPLLHLIRNAVDHGIEAPATRVQLGKAPVGNITVRAFRQGERVGLEVADDGRGLSAQHLREAAVRKNLMSAEAAAALEEAAALELIYLPGFSTSSFITSTSGRGVGMEVVKASVSKLGGTVEFWTQPNLGTRFTLWLPLTLTLARVLLVQVTERVYAIPAGAVERIVRLSPHTIQSGVGRDHLIFDGESILLFHLGRLLGSQVGERTDGLALILSASQQRAAVAIDQIIAEREVVLKPLGELLGRTEIASGVTLLPDRRLALVLDPAACLRAARGLQRETVPVPSTVRAHRLLVVEDSYTTRELERNILTASGYAVDTAVDGAEGWRKIQAGNYELIVTDVEMPNLNGFELTQAIRADERFADLPVIIVTSLEKESEKRRGLAVGAQAYLVKSSFEQTTLLETIERLLP